MPAHQPKRSTFTPQRGVAAVEFTLIAVIMIVLLLGMLVFWRTFQTQQTVNRAAGDGARHALTLITNGTYPCTTSTSAKNRAQIQATVLAIIQQQIKQAGLDDANISVLNTLWNCPTSTTAIGTYSFNVKYTLPPLLQNGQSWLSEPDSLQINERIVVHFQSAT